jgi:hypothetical protein
MLAMSVGLNTQKMYIAYRGKTYRCSTERYDLLGEILQVGLELLQRYVLFRFLVVMAKLAPAESDQGLSFPNDGSWT